MSDGRQSDRQARSDGSDDLLRRTELTGAEMVCADRAATSRCVASSCRSSTHTKEVINRHKTSDLSESQPTKGNIAGGLTTIEEKAFGNLQKIGRRAGSSTYSNRRKRPREALGSITWTRRRPQRNASRLQAAAGFVVHLFPTGQGNVIGNPIEPVIKLTANPKTARTMVEHIDLDVSGILRREPTLDKAGDQLIDMVVRTCNGRLTCAEVMGHREFVLTKLYQSA